MTDVTTIGVGIDGRPAKKGAQVVKSAFSDIRKSGKQVTGTIKGLDSALFALKSAFAGLGAIAATRALVNTEKQLQATKRGLTLVTGSVAAAEEEMKFLADTADELGLNLGAVEKAYVGLAAAANETGLEGQETRNIFLGISKAASVLGLSAEASQGALLAVQQIISKGKVTAEELRQQLGERLPGALQIMARALGVTTQELDAMMSNGELLAEEVLPLMSRQLEEEFGDAAVAAAEGITGTFNKLDNALLQLSRTIASSGILDPLIEAAIELTEVLGDPAFLEAAESAARGLGQAISFAAENADLFLKVGASIIALRMGASLVASAKGFLDLAKAATTAAAGSNTLVASLVAARGAMVATTAASTAAAGAMRALKLALPFAGIFLAVDALSAWVFGADDASEATETLKQKVDALAQSYENLSGARLEAAILDVTDRIAELQEAETAANVAVEQLATRSIRSDEDLTERNNELTRARAAAEEATEELYEAEALLAKLQAQAAGDTEATAKARNDAAKAAAQQARAEQQLAAVQAKSREDVAAIIAGLNERIATHGKGEAATLRYQVANGQLGETLRTMGAEGEAAGNVIIQLAERLDGLEQSTSRSSRGLSDAAREMQNARESANSLLADLQQQVDLFGRSAAQVDLYRVSVGDLSQTFGQLPDGAELAGRFLDLSAQLREAQAAQDRLTEAQDRWTQLVDQTINPVEDLNRQLGELYELETLLTEQADELGLSQEQIYEQVDRAAEGIREAYAKADQAAKDSADGMSEFAIQAARSIQSAFSDSLFDIMQGDFDNMGDRWKATLDRMVSDLIASQLLDTIGSNFGLGGGGAAGSGALGGGGGDIFGSIGSSIASFFAPGSAVGNTFTVPGSGGHDSTMMLAPVTPGETVRISTPSQEEISRRDGRGDVGDTAPITVSMTINTPDAGSFMASRGQIENGVLEMMQRGRRNS